MKPTLIKAVSAAVLTGTLLVSSYAPFTSQQVSAKTASDVKKDVQVTTQIKTITSASVYAKYADAKNDKAAHKLPAGTYVKKSDTVEVNGEKYYSITYSNAYEITSETNFYKKFKVLKGYVKVADTTKEKITISGFKSLFPNYPEDMTNLSTTTRYVVLDNLVSYLSSARFDDFEYPNHFMFIEKGTILTALDTFTINGQTYYARNYGLVQSIIPATSIKKVKTPTKVYTAAERKIVYKTTKDTFSRESFGKQFLTENHKLNKIKAGTQLQVLKEVTADGKNYVFIKVKLSKKQVEAAYSPYGWILKDRITKVK